MSAHLHAEDVGRARRRRVVAFALRNVGAVYAGGRDADEDLPGAGLWARYLGDAESVRTARMLDDDGAHACGGFGRCARRGRGLAAHADETNAM
jgi:hypothetical protein